MSFVSFLLFVFFAVWPWPADSVWLAFRVVLCVCVSHVGYLWLCCKQLQASRGEADKQTRAVHNGILTFFKASLGDPILVKSCQRVAHLFQRLSLRLS